MFTKVFWGAVLLCPLVASADMSNSELTRYQTTIDCVDKSYFATVDHQTAGQARIELINTALEFAHLPAYSQVLAERQLDQLDSKAYLAARDECQQHTAELNAAATRLGIAH